MSTPLPTQEQLQALFDYNPDTGELTWREGLHHKRQGVAGTIKDQGSKDCGHMQVRAGGRQKHYVHRLIWVWMTGEDPGDMVIDHISGDPADNRWANLRKITDAQNKSFASIRRTFWKNLMKGRFQIEQGEFDFDIYEEPENPSH